MSEDEHPHEPQATEASEQLTDEIARKYDPDRLLRMVSKRAGRGNSLDHDIRAKYEKRFGVDLGHVRVFTGEFAEDFNRSRGAHAVTVGATGMILMGNSAEKSMASRSGQALLAHELTHVAQARRGLFNADRGETPVYAQEHEHEAHAVEHEVEQTGSASSDTQGSAANAASKVKAEQKLAETIDKIKQRVMDMASDAHRTNWLRNNMSRRP